VLLAITAPVLGLHSPFEHNIQSRMQPPSTEHWFGTDHFGRDLFSRVIYGTRSSLIVAFASVALATSLGIALGLFAGYLGGNYDHAVMRLTDILMAFPSILLGIGLIAALGPSLINLVLVLALVRLPTLARVVRADAMSTKSYEFVEAARAMGGSGMRIALRHVFPNTIPSIIVVSTLALGQAVILEAAFGFLGLGVQPPTPSWGNLLAEGREFLRTAPYTSIFPGIFIALLALSFNLIGDGLRDYLDPRSRTSRKG
jgi:peptide/nickel transport system permease protein